MSDVIATKHDKNYAARPEPRPSECPSLQTAATDVTTRGADRRPLLRWLLAGVDILGAIATAPFALIVAIFGLQIGERRGHRQPVCKVCLVDVHDEGEICPKAKVADCSTCGRTVDLDRFLNHAEAGDRQRFHPISNIRPKPQPRILRSVK